MDEFPEKAVQRFADGEMTGAAQAEMALRVARDPALAKQVAHQQQLRAAVGRVMARPERAPADLRMALQAMAEEVAADDPVDRRAETAPPVIGRVGRWAPAAVAAALFLAALVTFALQSPSTSAPSAGPVATVPAVEIVPAAQIERFAKRHVTCSRSVEQLHGMAELPQQLTELSPVLAARLGQSTPGLDLSGLGYRFDRVGQCIVPGKGSVHMIYRAMPETGRSDALSLWIVPDRGDLAIEDGRVYTLASAECPHPTLVWRSGGLVYFLVGDAMDAVQSVANQLAGGLGSAEHG